jgi:hypothetical protein
MSIEKYKIDQFIREELPVNFTMLPNIVLNHLDDAAALGVWCHLMSKTTDWKVNRAYLMNKFKIGRYRLDKIMDILKHHKLLEYRYNRCIDGRIESVSIIIKNGIDFAKNVAKNVPLVFNNQIVSEIDTTTLKNHVVENPVTGETAPTKERIFTPNRKEINIFSSSGDERFAGFEEFWKNYPRRENKVRAQQAWVKNKCSALTDVILGKLKERMDKDWNFKELQFIPIASSYLNARRWEDELVEPRKSIKPVPVEQPKTKPGEAKSTVQFWGEGHPTYDALYGNQVKQQQGEQQHGQSNQAVREQKGGSGSSQSRGNGVRKASDFVF